MKGGLSMKKRYEVHMGDPGKLPHISFIVQAENEFEAEKLANKRYPKLEICSIKEK